MSDARNPKKMKRKAYERELARLEIELVKLEEWIRTEGLRVVVLFEGRDSAGKGGTIGRITRRLTPAEVAFPRRPGAGLRAACPLPHRPPPGG